MTLTALIASLQALETAHGGKEVEVSAEVRALGGEHHRIDAKAYSVQVKHVEAEASKIVISSDDGVES